MKEITRIHLAKIPYEIELEAKDGLLNYLNELKKYSGDPSIFEDVEIRITEILQDLNVNRNGIITITEVQKIRQQLGEPNVFLGEDDAPLKASQKGRRLYRDVEKGIFGGVIAGLAAYFNVDVIWLRILFLVLVPISIGWAIIAYLIALIVVPKAETANDILRMRGEVLTAQNITAVNEEYKNFDRSSRAIGRIVSIIFGVFSVLSAMSGIAALAMGNLALIEVKKHVIIGIDDHTWATILASSNLAGVLFVVFFSFLAYVLFSYKANAKRIIALIMIAVLGILSFLPAAIVGVLETQRQSRLIESGFSYVDQHISSNDISSIKKINAHKNVDVEYIVSKDNYRIEVSRYANINRIFNYYAFNFNDHELDIRLENSSYSPLKHRVRIYGPELEQIRAESYFKYNNEQSQDSLNVIQRNNSDVQIDQRTTIKNLRIDQNNSNFGRFFAPNLHVKNLNLLGDGGQVEIGTAEEVNGNLACQERTLDGHYDYTVSTTKLILINRERTKIKINGQEAGYRGNKCLEIQEK